MKGLLADVNVQGQVETLRVLLESPGWQDLWASLGLQVFNFSAVGLDADATDARIWRLCQDRQLVLITANRNHDGPDSLEATLQNENRPNSLPVITLADQERFRHSREYQERVAFRVLEILLDMANVYQGAGRIYVP
jgi:hypothetical protein